MILRLINYLMIVVFVLSTIVQYNDPDFIRWMLIYGAAGIVCILFAIDKLNWIVGGVVAASSCFWAMLITPRLTANGFVHMLDDVYMTQTGVEAAREFLGLLIICIWLGILVFSVNREKRENHSLQSGTKP